MGLHLGKGLSQETLTHPSGVMVILVLVRLAHWLRTRGRELSAERIVSELRATLLLAAVLSWAAGFWAITLMSSEAPEQQDLVILFASLGAVGAAFGLSSFPMAGRLPLILFALPFSAALGLSPKPAHWAVGLSLTLISLLSLRMLKVQDRGLVELVRSRSAIESGRERARVAEQAALREHELVKRVANTDSLTGLANRRAFLAALEARLGAGSRKDFAIALLDLDGFKPINDIFGHATGDALLAEVAARLRQICGNRNLVARVGGDEFGMIISTSRPARAMAIISRVSEVLGRPYCLDGREFRISACGGVVAVCPAKSDLTTTLRNGDIALYKAKEGGRGRIALFTSELERANLRRIELERALQDSSAHEQIAPVFQPILDLRTGELLAFEALARWHHPQLGDISPSEFIPIAEQNSLIEQVNQILLAKAGCEVERWPSPICLSFNLSAVEICSPNSADRLLAILESCNLDPSRVWFEVTETALLADFSTARTNLEKLREAGSRIALDDFGAGYASISYLREIAFDAVKLDGTLITGAVGSPRASQLLKGVLELCASLEVACVAEHIETEQQMELLVSLGCQVGQGFALSPPVDASIAAAFASGITTHGGSKNRLGLVLSRQRTNARRIPTTATSDLAA